MLLKLLKKDDPDYAKIAEETEADCVKMFVEAVDQEKIWAEYLFKGGSMIGLNTQLLAEYIEFIANKRMNYVNLRSPYTVKTNPLPWTEKWIAGSEVQVAPQETQISSYTVGAIKQDVGTDTFKGFSL
jgi:ribonucleoside-diphosphate reductase beta chain